MDGNRTYEYSSLAASQEDGPHSDYSSATYPPKTSMASEATGVRGFPSAYPRRISKKHRSKELLTTAAIPIAAFTLGCITAIGHHLVNHRVDGHIVQTFEVPQSWVTRIGTAFAFGFQTLLASAMSFVLGQLLWRTVQQQFFTIKELDTLYGIERRDIISTFLSTAMFKTPLMVLVAALSFLLPISAVFAPASLGVQTSETNTSESCNVPSGNLNNSAPSLTFFETGGVGYWIGATTLATRLVTLVHVGQEIPPLPRPCGGNCTYFASMDSFAFQCQPNDTVSKLLLATTSDRAAVIWNSDTAEYDPSAPFHVAWQNYPTSQPGGATCATVQARYDFAVTTVNGLQSVSYNITSNGPMPQIATPTGAVSLPSENYNQTFQVESLAAAARKLFLGNINFTLGASQLNFNENSPVVSSSFLNATSTNSNSFYTWGNVTEGIESISHNVSAYVLLLDLGTAENRCIFNRVNAVYSYDRSSLWLPYGIALLVVGICLSIGVATLLRFNSQVLSTSFSDTIGVTRNEHLTKLVEQPSDIVKVQEALGSTRLRLVGSDMGMEFVPHANT